MENRIIAIVKNRLFILLLFIIGFQSIQAQPTILAPSPCDMDRIARPFPIHAQYVREGDLMWSKRIWRVIDLREKMNHPLYYPTEPTVCLKSLFDVFKSAILTGDLKAFANPVFDDEFTREMTKEEVANLFVSWDSTHQIEDINNPGQFITSPVKSEITAGDISRYWIKEDWFFDKQRSVMEARIVGICPLINKLSEDGEVLGVKPLFWIYFPDARPYLARAATFNSRNDAERMSYDELFVKRKFSSYVYKESNVYNRAIADYRQGTDVILESEDIKEDIFKYESDLWQQ